MCDRRKEELDGASDPCRSDNGVPGTDVSDVLQKLATLFLSQGPN
jgi:hypothetical protein